MLIYGLIRTKITAYSVHFCAYSAYDYQDLLDSHFFFYFVQQFIKTYRAEQNIYFNSNLESIYNLQSQEKDMPMKMTLLIRSNNIAPFH